VARFALPKRAANEGHSKIDGAARIFQAKYPGDQGRSGYLRWQGKQEGALEWRIRRTDGRPDESFATRSRCGPLARMM